MRRRVVAGRHSRNRLVGPMVVWAVRLSSAHGDGHRAVPVPALSRTDRHARQARLRSVRAGGERHGEDDRRPGKMNIHAMKNACFITAVLGWLWLSTFVRAETPPPDELERSVALMAKTGSCNSPAFSPDGTRIAFISNMSGVPQVYIMPSGGGFPEQVTALDDPVEAMMWSPAGDVLAIQVAPGGGLNSQVYVLKPDGSQLRRLTDGGKENNFLDRWSPDGKVLAISSNRRDPATTDTYFVDVATGKMRMIAQNKGVGGVMD